MISSEPGQPVVSLLPFDGVTEPWRIRLAVPLVQPLDDPMKITASRAGSNPRCLLGSPMAQAASGSFAGLRDFPMQKTPPSAERERERLRVGGRCSPRTSFRRAPKTKASSTQGGERGPQLGGEELRLFPGGEVPAPLGLVEVARLGYDCLHPAPRRPRNLAGERVGRPAARPSGGAWPAASAAACVVRPPSTTAPPRPRCLVSQ